MEKKMNTALGMFETITKDLIPVSPESQRRGERMQG